LVASFFLLRPDEMRSQEAEMSSKRSPRRQFLKNGAALAGLAAGAISSPPNLFGADTPATGAEALHAYGERSHFEKDARIGSIAMWPIVPGARRDYGFRSPLQDSIGIITPASLHFIISHGHEPPDIDPHEHRLMIHGMVDRPLIF
jgi:sulfane dehydrogenase subunit SoxC